MSEAFLLASVAALGFAATNVDSLLLLVSLLAEGGVRRVVLVGYGLSIVLVVGVAWFVAQLGDWLPARAVDLLGFIPLAMGVYALVGLWRENGSGQPATPAATSVPAVAILMLSISADNFGVLIPLFAETPRPGDGVIATAVLASGLLWCGLALRLSQSTVLRGLFNRWGPRAVPLILIFMGIYILMDSATDR
jgi:cadmium resistance protein CadD (predicted permease)